MIARSAVAWLCSLELVLACALSSVGRASRSVDFARPLDSVFFIEKNENRNQVHYAVRVDQRCRPIEGEPVHAYWRIYEESQSARSPLLAIEERAYGIVPGQESRRLEGGGSVHLALRALPSRPIVIETFATGDGCRALAATRVHGEVGHLRSVYLEIGGIFDARQLVVRAQRLSDGTPLVERLRL